MQELYEVTTEDIIDVKQLDYHWLLKNAKSELFNFVSKFNKTSIGLTDEMITSVCVQTDEKLRDCFKRDIERSIDVFHETCYIDEILPRGKADLQKYLGDSHLFDK